MFRVSQPICMHVLEHELTSEGITWGTNKALSRLPISCWTPYIHYSAYNVHRHNRRNANFLELNFDKRRMLVLLRMVNIHKAGDVVLFNTVVVISFCNNKCHHLHFFLSFLENICNNADCYHHHVSPVVFCTWHHMCVIAGFVETGKGARQLK